MFSGISGRAHNARLVIQLIIAAIICVTGPFLSFGQDPQATATCPVLVAHDGYSGPARVPGDGPVPPDSVQAMNTAVKAGAGYVKFDVRWSADNVPVIIHNATVTASTGRPGYVRDYQARALTRMRLLTRTGVRTRDLLPAAGRLLRAAVSRRVSGVILEVKPDGITPGQARALRTAAARAGALGVTSLQTFFPRDIPVLARAWPSASIALLEGSRAYVPARHGAVTSVVLRGALVTPAASALIRRAGLLLGAYTSTGAGVPDDSASWSADKRDGVQQVFTDDAAGYLRWEARQKCRTAPPG